MGRGWKRAGGSWHLICINSLTSPVFSIFNCHPVSESRDLLFCSFQGINLQIFIRVEDRQLPSGVEGKSVDLTTFLNRLSTNPYISHSFYFALMTR